MTQNDDVRDRVAIGQDQGLGLALWDEAIDSADSLLDSLQGLRPEDPEDLSVVLVRGLAARAWNTLQVLDELARELDAAGGADSS